MERSIYCSLSELQDLYEYDNRNPVDWLPMVIGRLDSVYALSDQQAPIADEETFLSLYDGSTSQVGKSIAKINCLNKWLGDKLKIVTGINDLFPQRFMHGALCKSVAPDIKSLGRFGIEAIDDVDDKWVNNLRDHWYEDTVKDVEFSWKSFFGGELPTSNSVLFVDRYLFAKKIYGAYNVGSVLRAIIPHDYDQVYYVTIVFELNSLEWRDKEKFESSKLEEKDVEEINSIGNTICNALPKDKRVCLDFIAVFDPKSKRRLDRDTVDEEWNKLHNATHDRRIVSNYFQVMATQAISTTRRNNDRFVATYSQRIMYESLLSEIDNPRQNKKFIPFFTIETRLNDFSKCLYNAPAWAYCCFHFDQDNRQLMLCFKDSLSNPLLSLEKQG